MGVTGQYGMVLLSQFSIDAEAARTFQHFLYKDMPGALLPIDPQTGQPWYSPDDLQVGRAGQGSSVNEYAYVQHMDLGTVRGMTELVLATCKRSRCMPVCRLYKAYCLQGCCGAARSQHVHAAYGLPNGTTLR